MDANVLVNALFQLDDNTLTEVLAVVLQRKPQLAPAVVNVACPDLTYAPVRAITERRCWGIVKSIDTTGKGYGFISCPELHAVFGHDVFVHKKQLGAYSPGQEVNFAVLLNKDSRPQAFDLTDASGLPSAGVYGSMPSMNGTGIAGEGLAGAGHASAGHASAGLTAGPGLVAGVAGPGSPGLAGSGLGGGGACLGSPLTSGLGSGIGSLLTGGGLEAMQQQLANLANAKAGANVIKTGPNAGKAILGQCVGIIKSFNAEKGYGFIMSSDLASYGVQGDAYVHASQMGDFQVGSEVTFMLQLYSGRAQARDLKPAMSGTGQASAAAALAAAALSGQSNETQLGQLAQLVHAQGAAQTTLGNSASGDHQVLGTYVGIIKSYNVEKGFGFITCPELNSQGHHGDVYLHKKNVGAFEVGHQVAFTAYLHNGRLQGRDLQHATLAAIHGSMEEDPAAKRPKVEGFS